MKSRLPEKIAQIIPLIEEALIDLFELHKDDLSPMKYSIDGISFDLVPSKYQTYSSISFRQEKDYKNLETFAENVDLRYSPADWEHYSILNYDNCKSEKFTQVSKFIFHLFEELYTSVEDYDEIQEDINHLILTAAAEALLKPSVARKLGECGILNASVVSTTPDFCFEYIVKDVDRPFNFNYCEFILANNSINESNKKFNL